MGSYQKINPPTEGSKIQVASDGSVTVPDDPIIPYIEGDGIGVDITPATQTVVNAAVRKAYGGAKEIVWFEIYAGERAVDKYGADQWLPEDTHKAIREFGVSIKGPLTTPVGGGFRSLNVAIRMIHDLYACVRPVRWFEGVPSPMKNPGALNVVLFRENTEDIYAGIEWPPGSEGAKKIIAMCNDMEHEGKKLDVGTDSMGIGIKPVSEHGSKRLIRRAIRFALAKGLPSVTLVHKGNIMKFTEGAFKDWGYEVGAEEFPDKSFKGWERHAGRVAINDVIADAMFQKLLLRPDEYSVIATTNLNGDYLSDACAAQVGGLGMAPGGNIGDDAAVFEATHGTAPKYAGQDKVNPGSLICSAAMMLEHMGWDDAAKLIYSGLEGAISKRLVTYDLERQMDDAKLLKCSEFADAIVDNM